MTRRPSRHDQLSELLADVAAENQKLQPDPLATRLANLLMAAPMTPNEAAARLGCFEWQVRLVVAEDPLHFVDLGGQIGVDIRAR